MRGGAERHCGGAQGREGGTWCSGGGEPSRSELGRPAGPIHPPPSSGNLSHTFGAAGRGRGGLQSLPAQTSPGLAWARVPQCAAPRRPGIVRAAPDRAWAGAGDVVCGSDWGARVGPPRWERVRACKPAPDAPCIVSRIMGPGPARASAKGRSYEVLRAAVLRKRGGRPSSRRLGVFPAIPPPHTAIIVASHPTAIDMAKIGLPGA